MNWNKVWIIGNGPSRQAFDMASIRDETTIVMNKGLLEFPQASAFFSLDKAFIAANVQKLCDFRGEVYIALPDRNLWPDIPNAKFFTWSYASGLSDDPGVICTGCNSGFGALNLCYLNNSREVHLVGFDMDPKDPRETQYRFWSKLFDETLPQLNAKGIKVFNHNPNSYINSFEKVEINAFDSTTR